MGYWNNIILIILGTINSILGLVLGSISEKQKKQKIFLFILLVIIFIAFAYFGVRQLTEEQKEKTGKINNIRLTMYFHVDPTKIKTVMEDDRLSPIVQKIESQNSNETYVWVDMPLLYKYLRSKWIRESIINEIFGIWDLEFSIYGESDKDGTFEGPPLLKYKTLNYENVDSFDSLSMVSSESIHLGRMNFYVSYLIPLDNPKLKTIYDFNNKGIFFKLYTNKAFNDLNISGIRIDFDKSLPPFFEKSGRSLIFESGRKDETLNISNFYLIERDYGKRIWYIGYVTPYDLFT